MYVIILTKYGLCYLHTFWAIFSQTHLVTLIAAIIQEEVQRWTHNYIDVNGLVRKLLNAERANKKLREEIADLVSTF
jgi:hypothetical protein